MYLLLTKDFRETPVALIWEGNTPIPKKGFIPYTTKGYNLPERIEKAVHNVPFYRNLGEFQKDFPKPY